MKRFEYITLDVPSKGFWGYKIDFEEQTLKLNELGRKGREVVSMTSPALYQNSAHRVIIFLKRELNNN